MGSLRRVETAHCLCILFQCHTEQFFCDLLAFQTHDIVLHVIPGEQIHAAIPDDPSGKGQKVAKEALPRSEKRQVILEIIIIKGIILTRR